MLALWNIIITLLWPLIYLYPPFRGTVGARLGNFPPGGYDPAAPGLKVLINAVSAGEVVAIAPFIHALRNTRPDCQVVLLTTTDSGQTMARDKLGAAVDLLAYFPLIDLPFVVRRYLDRLRPDLYITTESELWPNIMHACNRRGVPVALVNARIYLHNKTGLRGHVVRRQYDFIDRIVCQDELHHANFIKFGIPAERLTVSGNTKFDFAVEEWDEERLAEEQARWGITGGTVLTAGSTHHGEEEAVLDALSAVRESDPAAKLILAPRHIERAAEVVQLAYGRGYTAVTMADHAPETEWDVLVVDRYGVLMDMYRLADVVIMGGTFHPKVGGHNILEATALAKPVVIGPHTYSITAQVAMLDHVDGIVRVTDAAGLVRETAALARDTVRREAIGTAALMATEANRGSAQRAVGDVLALLD